ncbi:hypothetical protein [Ekhidna sp.]|uniref:hypothetical protein n=1 Tax=Ekhidna sp. TaxID=2608089 RepID=UPI003BAA3134
MSTPQKRKIMFREEVEMTLECAVKMRKHLVRILENRTDSKLEAQLRYVNSLIMEADSMQMLAAVA